MKIAVIGAGISGLVAAYRRCSEHDITVFEANDYSGGHTNTVEVELDSERHAIDTGFIVFNDWTYPHFIGLLDELGVASRSTAIFRSEPCSEHFTFRESRIIVVPDYQSSTVDRG
jgi:predicted NAD/FAD-binding protein